LAINEDKDSTSLPIGHVAVAETMRSVSAHKEDSEAKPAKNGEEKNLRFWRVFGGTLLSIGALVVMTAYSGITGSIADLHKELNQEMEKRSEFARKDDFTRSATSQWTAIKEVQKPPGN